VQNKRHKQMRHDLTMGWDDHHIYICLHHSV